MHLRYLDKPELSGIYIYIERERERDSLWLKQPPPSPSSPLRHCHVLRLQLLRLPSRVEDGQCSSNKDKRSTSSNKRSDVLSKCADTV